VPHDIGHGVGGDCGVDGQIAGWYIQGQRRRRGADAMWRRRWVGLAPTVGRGREVWGGGRAVGVYGGEGGGEGGGGGVGGS